MLRIAFLWPFLQLERVQQRRGQQNQQIQQSQKQQSTQQQQPQAPLKQQQPQAPLKQPHRAPPIPRPIPSSRLRGAVRYFMLVSLNMDNWQLAQQEGAWATPLANEQKFGAAYAEGREVVFFMYVMSSGAIQGYGRMTSMPGRAPQVAWKGIDSSKFNNFYVSWDCTAPIPFEKVRELKNPWADHKMGALSKGPALQLEKHRNGQELAPQIGEQLIDAMNLHAAWMGKPATGLLAEGVPAARRRGAALGPAAGPAWQQQRQGMAGPQQQMHMQQQQQRMMAVQQQQMQQRGGMAGRGMMGGPVGPIGQQSRQVGPGGRMLQQQQPPPPGPRPANAAGLRAPGPGGPMGSDPRLNPRFAGRLGGLDDLPPANTRAAAPGRGGLQHSPPGYGRSDRDDRQRGVKQQDGRDRHYEREQGGDWDERGRQQEQRHGSRDHRHSRSRSRSPPHAASSRGGSAGRAGGGAVAESSWGAGGSSPEQRRRQEDEPESIQDMSYEQYLAAYERVQQRITQLKQVTGGAQQQPEPQLQLALLPGPPPDPPQQQQMAGGGMGMRGAAGVRVGGMGGGGGSMGGGMMVGGAANGDAMYQGTAAAAAGGAMGPGRPAGNPGGIVPLPE